METDALDVMPWIEALDSKLDVEEPLQRPDSHRQRSQRRFARKHGRCSRLTAARRALFPLSLTLATRPTSGLPQLH